MTSCQSRRKSPRRPCCLAEEVHEFGRKVDECTHIHCSSFSSTPPPLLPSPPYPPSLLDIPPSHLFLLPPPLLPSSLYPPSLTHLQHSQSLCGPACTGGEDFLGVLWLDKEHNSDAPQRLTSHLFIVNVVKAFQRGLDLGCPLFITDTAFLGKGGREREREKKERERG